MKSIRFFLYLFFLTSTYVAQSPVCPGGEIYIHNNQTIFSQPVSPAISISSVLLTNMPIGSSGLAVGPAFGFPAPNPTFWTTVAGTFWYYNGSTWINTFHSTGNVAAVNIGGGGSVIYNLVGTTGQVYAYTGTGPATLVTTISSFSSGGPFDIIADDNNNFYLLKTMPTQGLSVYDPAGNFLCSYSLTNSPLSGSTGGLAVVDNMVYYSPGMIGAISTSNTSITFTTMPLPSGTDWASCSMPVPTGLILAPNGGTLDCNNSTIDLVAQVVPGGIGMDPGPPSSTLTSCTYTWSGPGIIAGQNTESITVNQPGVYTFSVCSSGCPAHPVVQSFTVSGTPFLAAIVPPSCLSGPNLTLTAVPSNTANNSVVWSGPGIVGSGNKPSVAINAPGIYSVCVTNTLVNCARTATVNVVQPPSVSVALSSNTICAQSHNSSPVSLTLTPLGALTYSIYTSPNYVASGTGPWVCSPFGVPLSVLSLGSATIVGSNGVCTGSASINFSVIPNPTVAIAPLQASVCSGGAGSFTISGASTYSWLPTTGLNTYSASLVTANALATTVYSAYGSVNGCNSATQNNTLTVLPLPNVSIIPASSTICAGGATTLTATGSAASFTWQSQTMPVQSATVSVAPLASSVYSVRGSLNTCTSVSSVTVNVVQPPAVNMALSSNTLCAQGLNGSPNSITITPLGAISYTLLTGPNIINISPTGTAMPVVASGVPMGGITVATATLLGSNGFCTVSSSRSFSIVPNPVIASVPANTNICPGSGQLFTASGASSYTWSSNNGGLGANTGATMVASPSITTVYSVIGEKDGCNSGMQINILNMLPIPTISIAVLNPTICSGASTQLNASGNSAQYNWLPMAGLSATAGANVLASPMSTQNYSVIGSNNSCTNIAVATVSVIQSPTLTISASQYTACTGAAVYLNANGAASYSWAPSTGLSPLLGPNIIGTPNANTTFSVWGYNGVCTGSSTILVKTIPYPNILIEASSNQVCQGSPVTIKASGATNFSWMPSGNMSATTGSVITASPLSTTNYTIIGTNTSGTVSCSQQVSYSVMVTPGAKALASANQAICAGGRVTLNASGGDTYRWLPASGLNRTGGASVLAAPKASTIYTVEVSFNGYCGSTATVEVAVNPNPFVFAGRDTSFNADEPFMSLLARGTGTLTWLEGEGIVCADCPDTRITPRTNNCYVVEAVNSFGCKAQDRVCITLTDNYGIYIPNTFTPNRDGLNDVFFVYGTGLSQMSIEIYNRWGENVFLSDNQSVGWDGTYKGTECNPGLYIYSISYKGLDGKKNSKTGQVSLVR